MNAQLVSTDEPETLTQPVQAPPTGAPVRRVFSIKVFGVGGGGCNAVGHIGRTRYEGVEFICLNTDEAALSEIQIEKRFVLGKKLTRGLGAGGDPDVGRAAAEQDLAHLRELCRGADVVFVVAGLGGGTGTGAAPIVARVAKEAGALVLAAVMLPFEWEGRRRERQARFGLLQLTEEADGVICLPNQKLFGQLDEKTSLVETFALTHEFVAEGIRGIWRLLGRPGLINADFADLCSVTRGRHAESALATAQASGEHRAREVIERLLAHPLMDGGDVLTQSAAVLVSVVGGPDLTMAEVNRVMSEINRRCENAHIIVGAAIEADYAGKLALTVVASSGAEPATESVAAEEPEHPEPRLDLSGTDPRNVRCIPPPPALTPETRERLIQTAMATQGKKAARLLQGQLDLQIVSRGRFEKSEPTIYRGEDLDVPTYIRRGMALN